MPPRKRTRQETRQGSASGGNPAEKKLKEDLSQISIDELRKQLVDIGENPGPIDASNKYVALVGRTQTHISRFYVRLFNKAFTCRGIYVRLLTRKKLQLDTETSTDSSSFLDATSPLTSLTRSPVTVTSVGYMQGERGACMTSMHFTQLCCVSICSEPDLYTALIIMPWCACASEVYGSVFVCVCVSV